MAYTTVEKIKTMFRAFTSSTTNAAVTDASITEFIAEIDAIIDSRLSSFYELPIDAGNTAALAILGRVSRLFVAAILDDILNTYSEADKKPTYKKDAETLLNSLVPQVDKSGKWFAPLSPLPNVLQLGIPGNPNTQATIKVSSNEDPTFKKGVDAW